MNKLILVKQGEMVLKGLNRKSFEIILIRNIKRAIDKFGKFKIYSAQSTVYIEPLDDTIYIEDVVTRLSKVFGIVSICTACICEKNMNSIMKTCDEYLPDILEMVKTFKVQAKRADKKFALKSPEICTELGGYILEKFPHLTVDVHNPEFSVIVEIRDYNAFVHGPVVRGAGGMPIGSNGRAALLLSGGLDSPVAGYMTAKRGVSLFGIHFHSFPYTSERAKDKVIELGNILSEYTGNLPVYIVPFTKIQEEIKNHCTENLFTIIMRRLMMRIAEKIAVSDKCLALITGESIGQVASQTMEALYCTDNSVNIPVFRPVIGMDKDEIIVISRKIGCFETSILPYDDCCTLFAPKHPKTKPTLEEVILDESKLEIENLINTAVKETYYVICKK